MKMLNSAFLSREEARILYDFAQRCYDEHIDEILDPDDRMKARRIVVTLSTGCPVFMEARFESKQ